MVLCSFGGLKSAAEQGHRHEEQAKQMTSHQDDARCRRTRWICLWSGGLAALAWQFSA